jgi:hypothetical protein
MTALQAAFWAVCGPFPILGGDRFEIPDAGRPESLPGERVPGSQVGVR